jgi:WD40 repeat protein
MGSNKDNVWLWDMASGEPVLKCAGLQSSVFSVSIASDGSRGLAGDKRGNLCLYDFGGMRQQPIFTLNKLHEGVLRCCGWSPRGNQFCTGGQDGRIVINDPRAAEGESGSSIVMELEDAAATADVLQTLWFSEYQLMSSGGDYCAKRWDIRYLKDGPVGCYFGHTSPVLTLDVSEDHQFLATGDKSGSARVWLMDEPGMLHRRVQTEEHRSSQYAALRRKEQDLLEAGEGDPQLVIEMGQKVAICDSRLEELKALNETANMLNCTKAAWGMQGHNNGVTSLKWRQGASGRSRIVTGCSDATIRLFNVNTSGLMQHLVDPGEPDVRILDDAEAAEDAEEDA